MKIVRGIQGMNPTHGRSEFAFARVLTMTLLALLWAVPPAVADAGEAQYSPYVGRDVPDEVFFGDTHVHTSNSPDAFLFGVNETFSTFSITQADFE